MSQPPGAPVHVPGQRGGEGYDVTVGEGVLTALPEHAAGTAASRFIVIADATVAQLHGAAVLHVLQSAGMAADLVTFAAGEANKTRETWVSLSDRLLELRCGRDSCIVAFGGGVTGDLAGFVAATYMRGLPVIQVPTTLLAMIDASVGGKTGVDTAGGKNLIGAFHPPHAVLADTALLSTLPAAELCSGLAEAVKHGAILDAAYFDWIADHATQLLAGEPRALGHLVHRSVELKARVVAADPLEHGERAVLNFGHTVGHALEARSGYELPHGFAVALGMIAEAAAGERAGVTEPGTRERLIEVVRACGLPTAVPAAAAPADADALGRLMQVDKKARGGRTRLVLLSRLGAAARAGDGDWTHEVEEHVLRAAIRGLTEGECVV